MFYSPYFLHPSPPSLHELVISFVFLCPWLSSCDGCSAFALTWSDKAMENPSSPPTTHVSPSKCRKREKMLLTHCDWWRGRSLPINILQMQTVFSLIRALHHAAQNCQSAGCIWACCFIVRVLLIVSSERGFWKPDRMAFIFWNTCWLHLSLCISHSLH